MRSTACRSSGRSCASETDPPISSRITPGASAARRRATASTASATRFAERSFDVLKPAFGRGGGLQARRAAAPAAMARSSSVPPAASAAASARPGSSNAGSSASTWPASQVGSGAARMAASIVADDAVDRRGFVARRMLFIGAAGAAPPQALLGTAARSPGAVPPAGRCTNAPCLATGRTAAAEGARTTRRPAGGTYSQSESSGSERGTKTGPSSSSDGCLTCSTAGRRTIERCTGRAAAAGPSRR